MKLYGKTSLNEFLSGNLVYRNLNPMNSELPDRQTICTNLGFSKTRIPRKTEPAYAQILTAMILQAQKLRSENTTIKKIICVGDTRMNDGTAFENLSTMNNWPGLCFIGSENTNPIDHKTENLSNQHKIFLANRWASITVFENYCEEHGFTPDENTVVLIDMDKTMLGARGRNAHVIDKARIEGVRKTVAELLSDNFDPNAFETAYNRLNQPEFHPFTADNQDYLAYICLILGSGLVSLDTLITSVQTNQISNFRNFIDWIDTQKQQLPSDLKEIHQDIYKFVSINDPTPFKKFRRMEYKTTIQRMGNLPENAPLDVLLNNEIVITQEVREMALRWKTSGALIFGISDKPDEASTPTSALQKKGFVPIHETQTHSVGN